MQIAGSTSQSGILPHRAWVTARDMLMEAVSQPAELVALLGGPGVGKTLLLLELERHWTSAGRSVAFIENGDLVTGMEPEAVLLIDEAERITDAMLQRLPARSDQVVVLAGLPGFVERLRAVDFLPVALTGLEPDEIAPYLALRMQALGDPPARFSAEAVAAVGSISAGVPRLLNLLVGSSVFTAGLDGSATVTAAHVRAAAEMHDLLAAHPVVEEMAAAPEADECEPPSDTIRDPVDEPPLEIPIFHRPMFSTDLSAPAAAPAASHMLAPADPLLFPPPPLHADVRLHTEADPPAPPPAPPEHLPAPKGEQRKQPWIWLLAAAGVAFALGSLIAWQYSLSRQPAQGSQTLSSGTPDNESRPTPDLSVADANPVPAEAARIPVEQTDEMASLPGPPAARVVLVHPMGDGASAARANRLMATLRDAGLRVAAPFPVPRGEERDRLRYFFHEDRATAVSVANLAGNAAVVPTISTLPAGVPLPRPGTVEWVLPRGGAAQLLGAPREPPVTPPPSLPTVTPLQPAQGSVIDAPQWPFEAALAWALPASNALPCCFVEVQMLISHAEASSASGAVWREVFSGYAADSTGLVVTLDAPGVYAWRILGVSPGVPHYTTGPWSRFTVKARS